MALELNPFQDRAATAPGHVTILACPGSGKTRVLSTRAGHLIANNELGRLCAVTFTKDAASELLERIVDTCGKENVRRIAAGTFHSLAKDQIRRNTKGRLPKLLNEFERNQVLKRCWREVDTGLKFEEVQKEIDKAKANIEPIAFQDLAMQRIYESYEAVLESENAMEFADLTLKCIRGMQAGTYAPLPIRWMLVDETQDMDAVQMQWILLHGISGVEITLVGDDDQSLYSFRHAMGYEGLQEASLALGSLELSLPVNYRCAPNILASAAKLIAKNNNRASKNIQAFNEVPGELVVHRLPARSDEMSLLVKTLQASKGEDWAILGRTNALLDLAEIALSTSGIFYERSGGKSVWDQAIGGVFAGLLRSISDQSWTGVANALAFCGMDNAWINEHSRDSSGRCIDRLEAALSEARDDSLRRALNGLREGFISWTEQAQKGRTSLVIHGVSGYLMRYCKPPQAGLLKCLADSICRLNGSLAQRLSYLTRDAKNKEATAGAVQIMTLHSSKGLEFHSVWIMACEEGNLPHSDSSEEEERRLMYVGMTRAKRKLMLSGALQEGLESRFWEEAGLCSDCALQKALAVQPAGGHSEPQFLGL